MVGFGSRYEALAPGKKESRLKDLRLVVGCGLHDPFPDQKTDDGGITVVAKPSCVDGRGHEVVAQGVHLEEGGHAGHVSEVVGEGPLGEGGTGLGFHCHQAHIPSRGLIGEEGQGDASQIRTSSAAADDHVGILPHLGQLFLGLQTDYRLMEEDMVQDGAQGVMGVVVGDGVLHGLADGQTQGSGVAGVLFQDGPACLGLVTGTGIDGASPGFHHGSSIGLLIVTHPHHIYGALQAKESGGKGEGRSPLTGPRLRGEALYA